MQNSMGPFTERWSTPYALTISSHSAHLVHHSLIHSVCVQLGMVPVSPVLYHQDQSFFRKVRGIEWSTVLKAAEKLQRNKICSSLVYPNAESAHIGQLLRHLRMKQLSSWPTNLTNPCSLQTIFVYFIFGFSYSLVLSNCILSSEVMAFKKRKICLCGHTFLDWRFLVL